MIASSVIESLLHDAIKVASSHYRVPTSTYRLQMHAGFTLRDALRIIPYLHRLGVSHLYMSSLLMARPGSLHGYDVMNHSCLNPELGDEDDLKAVAAALRDHQMGLLLDTVPNHMWVGEGNEWWMDVLENGPSSRFADYFDIAWRNHPRERLRNKVLLPILDEPYGKVIQAGRLAPFFEQGRFGVMIDQTRLPLDPRTYTVFLDPALESLREQFGEESPSVLELQSIVTSVRHLPARDDCDPEHVSEVRAEGAVIKRRLRELAEQHPEVATQFERATAKIAGDTDDPASLTGLIELLDSQSYRPSFWRVALDEINYRRFFDVNDLAALAAERIDVFQATHAKIFEWLRDDLISGLRIDHIDGLLKPKEYLDRLQQYYVIAFARQLWEQNPARCADATWTEIEAQLLLQLGKDESLAKRLYVVIEKILGPRESLPADWVCDGTTGYEFVNQVNALFVDPESAENLTKVYQTFTHQNTPFEQLAYENKLQILRSTMASELSVLAHHLDRLAQMEWWSRDFTLNGLRQALEEMIACFSVYRSYVSSEAGPSDRNVILRAAGQARRMSPYLGKEIFHFICDTLLLREPENAPASADYREQQQKFAGKFQQLTSPVMAKGVEDTAIYIFNRLASLNEVGGNPAKFGSSPEELHTFLQDRSDVQPNGLSPLSTHDTKRSEDVRARINVLSEIPEEWNRRIDVWNRLNRSHKVEVEEGVFAPSENEEYFIYQTLVGVWPCDEKFSPTSTNFIERIQAYMAKALREAKVHSSWISPDAKYDAAVAQFIESILNEETSAAFLTNFRKFLSMVHPIGRINSLSQTLIRCTAPGVPDIYQGCETWDYSLVDPDNRRPVDYTALLQMLEQIETIEAHDPKMRTKVVHEEMHSEHAKLFVTAYALRLRRAHEQLFKLGNYTPLQVVGSDASHVFGFLMSDDTDGVLTVVPRLISGLSPNDAENAVFPFIIDAELSLPEPWSNRRWRNVLTGASAQFPNGNTPAAHLFRDFPVGLYSSVRD